MVGHDIIVIGASAGGLPVLSDLVAQLPGNLNAAIFIVQHISKDASGLYLVQSLGKVSSLQCKIATEGDIIKPGVIYIAPSDQHLLFRHGNIHLSGGARENRYRPSIDVLFRSAAVTYSSRVIGVILTGMLDDGTSGLSAIHQCGGMTIVQDPDDAAYPVMSINALLNVPIDYRISIAEMGVLLQKLVGLPANEDFEIPETLRLEARLAEQAIDNIEVLGRIGATSVYSCPDCGGSLWQVQEGNLTHYRCHTGHVYSENSLVKAQDEALENTLWVALRILEERKNMLTMMADRDRSKGFTRAAALSLEKAEEIKVHINRLRHVLFSTNTERDQNSTDS